MFFLKHKDEIDLNILLKYSTEFMDHEFQPPQTKEFLDHIQQQLLKLDFKDP
jgi:hypothetical protein